LKLCADGLKESVASRYKISKLSFLSFGGIPHKISYARLLPQQNQAVIFILGLKNLLAFSLQYLSYNINEY
jgi:hypothetical protein